MHSWNVFLSPHTYLLYMIQSYSYFSGNVHSSLAASLILVYCVSTEIKAYPLELQLKMFLKEVNEL